MNFGPMYMDDPRIVHGSWYCHTWLFLVCIYILVPYAHAPENTWKTLWTQLERK